MMHNELNLLNMKENHKQQQKKNLSFQKKKKGGGQYKMACQFIKSSWSIIDHIFVTWFNSQAIKLKLQ